MSKVQALPIMRLKYFNCKKGDLHDGQVLNYVCIQKGCQERGLICSVCKIDHNGHNVIPLKYLLNKLKQHKQNSAIESQSFQTELVQLEQLKNSFLYDLKQTVQQLAQKIQQVEEYIIERFKKQKVQLLSQVILTLSKIEIKMRFNEIIESAIHSDYTDQNSFERDFRLIVRSVEVNSDSKLQGGVKGSDLYFSANLEKVVNEYENGYQKFNKQLINFSLESANKLSSLMKEQIVAIQKNELFNQAQSSYPPPQKVDGYKFNITQKGQKFIYIRSNIKISDSLNTAEFILAGNERFALIDGAVHKKGSTIRFKIQKLKNWVGVGLAVRDIIKGKKFHFQYSNLGHGSYLLSNNSYMWSHTSAAHNVQNSQFTFTAGQIVKIEVTEKQLIYTNESDNKEKKIPISLTEHEWTQACFCVNLCSLGDAATIL